MAVIYKIDQSDWRAVISSDVQKKYADALESGGVLLFEDLSFPLSDDEKNLLMNMPFKLKAKNISYHPATKKINGVIGAQPNVEMLLKNINSRFYNDAAALIQHLFPFYQPHLKTGMTSLRPVEIEGRPIKSIKKDDTRLHVDAFPSRPNQGKRILRVFSNINFEGKNRVWRVGAPMQTVCEHFFPRLRNPVMGMACLYKKLGITKGYRARYDSYMLQLHDLMKMDQAYQDKVSYEEVEFPPGSTWVVFSDSVSHAALAGQHMMEQTFYLSVEGMQQPALSPLKILEKMAGRVLS